MSAFPTTPAVTTPAQPPQRGLTVYPAYEKNGLKISLTPQPLAARPGVVMILARFQVTGSETAVNLSFQAAVPKVSPECLSLAKMII
jgi:AP-1 complex subunit gamma-1